MRKKSFVIIGAALVFFTLQSCSPKPEESLLKRYFNAMNMNDNTTMSSMALEPMVMDVSSFDVVSVSPEKIETVSLAGLNKMEADLKKKLEAHVGPTIDAKDALDKATDEMGLSRTKGSKQAAQQKVDEIQAKYDQEFAIHKELQKSYNDAKSAASREEEIAAFSLGNRSLTNIRDMTGTVHSKEIEIKARSKSGETKRYRLHMRSYNLKDETANLKYNGRWIIVKFESLA